jgi:hypothetical protein
LLLAFSLLHLASRCTGEVIWDRACNGWPFVSKVLGSATGRYWLDMEFKQWNGDDCKRIPNYLILMGWVWI